MALRGKNLAALPRPADPAAAVRLIGRVICWRGAHNAPRDSGGMVLQARGPQAQNRRNWALEMGLAEANNHAGRAYSSKPRHSSERHPCWRGPGGAAGGN